MPKEETTIKSKQKSDTGVRTPFLLSLIGTTLFCTSCANIDCPLDNIVVMTSTFYASETDAPTRLTGSLSIAPAGRDTLLLNQARNIDKFILPLRHQAGTDTLLLRFSNDDGRAAEDTLFVTHDIFAHFENIDCPANIFHRISNVRHTNHVLSLFPATVDHVEIIRPLVDYDDVENLRIFLRSTTSY